MSANPASGRDSPQMYGPGRPSDHPYPPPPQGPPGSYPPPPQHMAYPPPHHYQHPAQHRPDMQPLAPPHHDPYRGQMSAPQYDMYHAQQAQMGYPPPQQAPMAYTQPAPRQRTAIACRYCRRRKIRCHGFDSNPEGRCNNCTRFHQECIFTPVSASAHAFVPAHTAYPHLRNTRPMAQTADGRSMYPGPGPALYGPQGQPLQMPPHDPNYPPPAQQPYGTQQNPYPSPAYDGRHPPPQPDDQVSRKRLRGDDHYDPALAPPRAANSYPEQRRRASAGGPAYDYPDPAHMTPLSPALSTASYPAGYPAQQPYYHQQQQQQQPPPPQQAQAQQQRQPQRRSSPAPSAYSYDNSRASASPHGGPSSAFAPYPGSLHPPQVLPPAAEGGRTTPSNPQGREGSAAQNASAASAGAGANASRAPGMSVRDMLGPNDQGNRSAADSSMVNALRRAP